METQGHNIWASLLIVMGLAFTVPILFSRLKRFRVPVVVGEILAGIAFGQSGLGLIEENTWLNVLSTLGFTYLLFLAGLEIDFGVLTRAARRGARVATRTFGLPALTFALTLVAGLGASYLLQGWGLVENPFLMALVLSTTSLGIVVPILKERRLTGTDLGQAILLATILADFGTMLLITLAVALERGHPSGEIWLVLVLFLVFFPLDWLIHRLQKLATIKRLMEATSELGVRASFLLMFVFVVLSEQLGVEYILGSFLAGALVSLAVGRVEGRTWNAKLDAIGFGFFIPIFFIMVGARFDLAALTQSAGTLLLVPALLLMRYAVKVVPALLFRVQFPWRETLATGWILAPGLTLMIAASDVGLQAGLIDETMNAAIVLLAIVTSTLSPLFFERTLPPPQGEERRERLLVMVGASQNTLTLAQGVDEGEFDRVCFIESNPDRAARAQAAGFQVIAADATKPESLEQAGVHPDAVVVIATRKDELNCQVAELAHEKFKVRNVIALANTVETADKLRKVGARPVTPALATHVVLDNLIHDPEFFGLLQSDALKVQELVLRVEPREGHRIRDLPLPEGVLILSIHRDVQHLMPKADMVLEQGDRITLMGQPRPVKLAVKWLRQIGDWKRV